MRRTLPTKVFFTLIGCCIFFVLLTTGISLLVFRTGNLEMHQGMFGHYLVYLLPLALLGILFIFILSWTYRNMRKEQQSLQSVLENLEQVAMAPRPTVQVGTHIALTVPPKTAYEEHRTDLEERVQELVRESHILRAVIDCIPDLIFYKSEAGRYEGGNKAFLEFAGIELEKLIGRTDREVFTIDEEMAESFRVQDQITMRSAHPTRIEEWITYPDGRRFLQETVKTSYGYNGIPLGLLGISRDITQRYIMEESLRESQLAAQAASIAKSEFLATMSHEIRTPLNGIIGMNYLALQHNPPPELRGYLQKIESSAKNLLSVINDILDFSKIEAGKIEIEQQTFSVRDALAAVEDMMQLSAHRKQLTLECVLAPNMPDVLMGDSLRVNQILLNLISNALKFTEQGSIFVEIRVAEQVCERIRVEMLVQDTGIGMSAAQMERLFSAFHQADSSISRRYGGTGLGLSICRGLINKMGGTIQVYSELGQGTCFMLDIWLTVPSQEGVRKFHAEQVEAEQQGILGLHVLLAEDNEINQMIAVELLEQFKCTVDVAANGMEAVTKAQSAPYDVILMDIQMPEMDGFEATRILRGLPSLDKTPIIAMTAHALESDRDKSMLLGMQAHISKPINVDLLYHTLSQYRKNTVLQAPNN